MYLIPSLMPQSVVNLGIMLEPLQELEVLEKEQVEVR
jgi:hypothetical protein